MAAEQFKFIYGAGISGCGIAEVLAKKGEKVLLFNDNDKKLPVELLTSLEKNGGKFIFGTSAKEESLPRIGEMIISPGISITNTFVQKAAERGIKVIGEVEAATRYYQGKMIAITGTNGKTTTTTLVGEMLKSLPVKTAVGGNIGSALSKEVEGLDKDSWLTAELSSFQLESTKTLKPHIALILNITPDHLERHGGMTGYIEAKAKVFTNQTAEDILVLNYDDLTVRAFAQQTKSKVCFISRTAKLSEGIYLEDGKFVIGWQGQKEIVCAVKDLKIFGSHNEENVLGAIACAYFAGVSLENIKKVLVTFEGVEHRLEYVTSIAGVAYYNDSKATNPDSTIKALEAFSGGIVLLAGGHDKHTDLTAMMKLVKEKTAALILLGEAKERFFAEAQKAGVTNIYLVETFEAAVDLAYNIAKKPQVVVLSPACSSFDMFDNFPQRGEYFKKLVRNLV